MLGTVGKLDNERNNLFSDKDECASNNGGCSHNCANTYLGRRCYCKPGYRLQSDKASCTGNVIRFFQFLKDFSILNKRTRCKCMASTHADSLITL